MKVMNDCLKAGIFPSIWKSAKIVWVPKRDGLQRSICLLPALERILDNLLNQRVQYWCERMSLFSDEQSGFRSGRSTVDTVSLIVSIVQEQRDACVGGHQNAFNMAWRPGVIWEMGAMGLPDNLRGLCDSFMSEREVRMGSLKVV